MSEISADIILRTKGILPMQKLKLLAEAGILTGTEGYPIEENQFQPNSIDLRLGETAYRVRSSFLPENETVDRKSTRLNSSHVAISYAVFCLKKKTTQHTTTHTTQKHT